VPGAIGWLHRRETGNTVIIIAWWAGSLSLPSLLLLLLIQRASAAVHTIALAALAAVAGRQ